MKLLQDIEKTTVFNDFKMIATHQVSGKKAIELGFAGGLSLTSDVFSLIGGGMKGPLGLAAMGVAAGLSGVSAGLQGAAMGDSLTQAFKIGGETLGKNLAEDAVGMAIGYGGSKLFGKLFPKDYTDITILNAVEKRGSEVVGQDVADALSKNREKALSGTVASKVGGDVVAELGNAVSRLSGTGESKVGGDVIAKVEGDVSQQGGGVVAMTDAEVDEWIQNRNAAELIDQSFADKLAEMNKPYFAHRDIPPYIIKYRMGGILFDNKEDLYNYGAIMRRLNLNGLRSMIPTLTGEIFGTRDVSLL